MTKTEAFSNLKPGDRVAINTGRFGKTEYQIATVDKVTPTGRIVIGSRQYNPDGWERGGDTWNRYNLVRLTPELEQRIAELKERARIINKLRDVKWGDVPTDKLRAVAAALEL